MNRTIFARIAASLVLASLGMGATYYLGVRQGQRSAPTQAAASAQAADAPLKAGDIDPKTGKRILYWQDPMAPGQRFDKPGKSPFMDMPLAPVYENGAGGSAAVTVDGRVAQNLAVRTAEVKTGRLDAMLEVPGNIAINERGIEIIQARAAGFVERAYAKTTLDPVKRGQPLIVVYAPEWVAAQEEYLAVSRTANALQGDLRSAALLRMRQAGMTEAQIRLVESTGKPQPRLAISSDIDGVITEVGVFGPVDADLHPLDEGGVVAIDLQLDRLDDAATLNRRFGPGLHAQYGRRLRGVFGCPDHPAVGQVDAEMGGHGFLSDGRGLFVGRRRLCRGGHPIAHEKDASDGCIQRFESHGLGGLRAGSGRGLGGETRVHCCPSLPPLPCTAAPA